MFEPVEFQMYWPRPYIGGPKSGEYHNHTFTSVPAPGYSHAVWFDADGCVIAEIHQHDSIRTVADFHAALADWSVKRGLDSGS
jgi:hypothetical protein